MQAEKEYRERLLRGFFALLVLVVPILVVYDIVYQFRTPVMDFFLAEHDSSVIGEVVPGGKAEEAGLRVGDIFLSLDGVSFPNQRGLKLGQTYTVQVERNGQLLTFAVPPVAVGQLNRLPLASTVLVILIFWSTSTLYLARRFQQGTVRLLFLLAQTGATLLLTPLAHPGFLFAPPWLIFSSVTCLYLAPPLLLHYCLTFPVRLGTPRQRRWLLGLLYGLAIVIGTNEQARTWLDARLRASFIALQVIVAVAVLVYVYARRANPDSRRRLRLIVLGTGLATIPPVLFYLLPVGTGIFPPMPEWLTGLFLALAPLSYLYATVQYNLFGIDRLLNRALVYTLLSLAIFALYLGPLLLLYRLLPDDLLLQTMLVAGLTLLVGWNFDWMRTRVQRLVDRLFYGGWYDYPAVVETVSDALARSLARDQLEDVLTHQVPEMMQLHPGELWIGESVTVPQRGARTPSWHFPLSFEGQARGLWRVGRRLDGDDLTTSDRRILQTLAHQAEIALSNVLLVETLRRRLDEIRKVQHRLLRSREEERARLARDLHDGPIQLLVGLNIQLGLLLSSGSEALLSGELKAIRGEVRGLLADLRQVCADLRPPMLDTLGLSAALRALVGEWEAQHGKIVDLTLPPDAALRSLPAEVAVNLYWVVQEALSNAARHALAGRVRLSLAWNAGRLEVTIEDDGRGFAVPGTLHSLMAEGHFGLVGMQERVDLIGGELAITSAPERGTRVQVVWEKGAES